MTLSQKQQQMVYYKYYGNWLLNQYVYESVHWTWSFCFSWFLFNLSYDVLISFCFFLEITFSALSFHPGSSSHSHSPSFNISPSSGKTPSTVVVSSIHVEEEMEKEVRMSLERGFPSTLWLVSQITQFNLFFLYVTHASILHILIFIIFKLTYTFAYCKMFTWCICKFNF